MSTAIDYTHTLMNHPTLDTYDWAEVFGEGDSLSKPIPDRPLGSNVSIDTFSREDISTICGQEDGEHDGPSWIIWGALKDGRWFYASGGCCYTGWDCRGGNSASVAGNRDDLVRYCMGDDDRKRFKLTLPAEKPEEAPPATVDGIGALTISQHFHLGDQLQRSVVCYNGRSYTRVQRDVNSDGDGCHETLIPARWVTRTPEGVRVVCVPKFSAELEQLFITAIIAANKK